MGPGAEYHEHELHGEGMLAAAEENFRGILLALVEMRRRLELGDDSIPEPELRQRLSGVHKAIQAVFDERKRLDDIRKARGGTANDRALDLQFAEQTVRSRLARIRADLDRDTFPSDP